MFDFSKASDAEIEALRSGKVLIEVCVVDIRGDKVRLGVTAPKSVGESLMNEDKYGLVSEVQTVPVSELSQVQAIASLTSTLCPHCAGKKKARMTLCGVCYYKLPQGMRARLYDSIYNGYCEAIAKAFEALRDGGEVRTFILPPPRKAGN